MLVKYNLEVKKKTSGLLTLSYEDGLLKKLEVNSEMTEEQLTWLKAVVPAAELELLNLPKQYNFITIEPVPADLTFNAFWDSYAYKVGNKERTIKLWSALNDSDRTRALAAIPRYNQWLAQKPNMERLYPMTYLSQRRWESSFKV